MQGPLIIYHGNCSDGFAAAWVASRALGPAAELFEGLYGQNPPLELAEDRDVFVVDFSYPRAQLEALNASARSLLVLDHHKTARANLEGLPYCVFDMERSGAGMAWDHFHPDEPRPWVVDYVEDRDLWRFKLPHSEALSLRIRVTPHDLNAWDALSRRDIPSLLGEATGAKLYVDHLVRDAVRGLYVLADVDGHGNQAACVNVSYTCVSDVLADVLSKSPAEMAIGWQVDDAGMVGCSVRSRDDFDCSKFALAMGGGGHPNASGFRVPHDHPFAARLMHRAAQVQ